MTDGIAHAATGYFTCTDHEQIFAPADQVTISTTAPPRTTLDLMALRSIMHRRWWNQLWANAAETIAKTEQDDKWLYITNLMRSGDKQLLTTQLAIEQCLRSDPIKPPLEHLVFASEGYPVLTAATFGVGLKTDELQPIGTLGLWGMTVVPGGGYNAVCLHFRPEDGLLALRTALPNFINENSKITGAEMTRAIMSQCDDVVFSEESWDALNAKQQSAVLGAFGMAGREYVGPDIFSGAEWSLIK